MYTKRTLAIIICIITIVTSTLAFAGCNSKPPAESIPPSSDPGTPPPHEGTLPDPNKIDIEMYADEIYKDGSVMDTGEIIIQGTRAQDEYGSDALRLSNLQIMDIDLPIPSDPILILGSDLDVEYETISCYVLYRGDPTFMSIHLSKDRTWCVIVLGSRLFVASTKQNFDPAAILDRFPELVK